MGKNAEAIPEYKKTLELKPDLYQAELNLGISLLREKQPAQAVPYFTAQSRRMPKNTARITIWPRRNWARAISSKPSKPTPPRWPSIQNRPMPSWAWRTPWRAKTSWKTRLLISKKPPSLNPNYRDDLLELASMYEKANQPEQAIAIYQQFPDNPGAQERLGDLLLKAGKPSDAIPHFQFAVAKSPTEANRAALAEAYLKNNEPDKAQPLVEQILAADPDNFEIRMLHGRLIRDQRKFPEAAEEFERATKLKPDAPQAWSELAGVLVMAENYQPALAALDRIAALHAEKPGHVFLRAIVLDKIRDLKPALESYQRFLQLSQGENPNQEWQARQRIKTLEREINNK